MRSPHTVFISRSRDRIPPLPLQLQPCRVSSIFPSSVPTCRLLRGCDQPFVSPRRPTKALPRVIPNSPFVERPFLFFSPPVSAQTQNAWDRRQAGALSPFFVLPLFGPRSHHRKDQRSSAPSSLFPFISPIFASSVDSRIDRFTVSCPTSRRHIPSDIRFSPRTSPQ